MHKPRLLLIAILVATFAATAFGAETTGTLFGVVSGADGEPLPGVTVTVSSPALQGSRTAATNTTGEYNLPLLPPGAYRAVYVLQGFDTAVRSNIVVSLDQAIKVNVPLALSRVAEAITVTGDAVVIDPTQTNTQLNLKEDHLQHASIGLAGRSYQDVVNQAPGAGAQTGSGGNPSIFGGNLGANSYLIDGLNTTDPVTHTFTSNFTFDTIQEVAIQTSGFEAEYGRATGGIINVITKSGGNEFHGSLDARYRSEEFTEEGERRREFPVGTDLLRYDKDTQDFKNFDPAATLGGPIARDRIWFFASVDRPDFEVQQPDNNGFLPGRRDFEGWNYFGKVTATPAPSHTLALKFDDESADIANSQNSSLVSPEADSIQVQDLTIYNLTYDAVLSSTWLASAQIGYLKNSLTTQPISGDLATTGSIDAVTNVRRLNYFNFQSSDRPRLQALASTTYYLDALGSHSLKSGADVEWTEFQTVNITTGTPPDPTFCSESFGQPAGASCGAILRPNRGAPFLLDVSTNVPEETFESRGMAFYLQDEWRPVPRVTAKLGVRYDEVDFFKPADEKVKTFARFQPRVGVAWDLFNDSSTIIKANAGEFMEDNALTLPSFLSDLGSVLSRFQWSNSQQRFVFVGSFGGPSGNELDPRLRPTYSQTVTAGISQRLFRNTSLDVTGVYRKYENIFEDSCADEDCHFYWLTNRPNDLDVLKSRYKGLIFKVESRPTAAMSWVLSYTLSESKSAVEYTQNAGTDFDVFPFHFDNRYGFTSDDAKHVVKLDGYTRLPWEFFVGTSVYWDSGVAYNTTRSAAATAGYGTEFVEPRGTRRQPDFYRWDLQVEKYFGLGPVRIGVIGSVFNVLDTEIATVIDGNVGAGGTPGAPTNPRFGFATTYQRPRSYEAGFRVTF